MILGRITLKNKIPFVMTKKTLMMTCTRPKNLKLLSQLRKIMEPKMLHMQPMLFKIWVITLSMQVNKTLNSLTKECLQVKNKIDQKTLDRESKILILIKAHKANQVTVHTSTNREQEKRIKTFKFSLLPDK